MAPEAANDFKAIHFWHHHIEQNQIRTLFEGALYPGDTGFGFDQIVHGAIEGLRDDSPHERIVIHDEDFLMRSIHLSVQDLRYGGRNWHGVIKRVSRFILQRFEGCHK